MEEEEEVEEMDIEDEMDDLEIINPYEIEEGKLPPPHVDSNTSSDSEPKVEAEDEDEDEATIGTITHAPYSTWQDGSIFVGISMERRRETQEHHKLKQSVSTLEDQMRGLMLEDKEEKESLKKKLRVSQQEKEQIDQVFRHMIDWIHKQFGVKIPTYMGDGDESNAYETGGQDRAPPVREVTFSSFMKCNLTPFHGKQGAIELCRWFEKSEMVFSISDYAKRNKVKFVAATLQGRALTWWNSQVATLGLNVTIGKSWGDMKKMMLEEFCPDEEFQLRKKVEAYIKGLPENIKGEVTSSRPVNLNEAIRMAHTLMEKKVVATGANTQSTPICYGCEERCHTQNHCPNKNNPQGEEAHGRDYVIKEVDKDQGPNVVMGTFLLNNRYATVLFDSSSDKSFVNTSFSHFIDIDLVRLDPSYEVELADGRVASTYIVLKGYIIKLVGHLFKIDLMPIELGTFDVIIGMDWLVKQDAVIVCGKKAKKFIKRGSQLFVAHVAKKEPQEKRLEDVPVIRDFPEVFPDDLSGLPPPWQVEFRINLVPGTTPVARVPYRLAPLKMKELAKQLQVLSEKGFIRPSSSP
nr:hypothetical protein [Tanacetum cinerariifolium]